MAATDSIPPGLEFGEFGVQSAADEKTLLHCYVGITWLPTLLHPEQMVVDSPFLLVESSHIRPLYCQLR